MIDVKTGLTMWSVEALTLAAILMVAWAHKRPSVHYLLWSLGLVAHGAGTALVAARGHIPAFLSIEVANAIALCSYSFGIAGLRFKDGKPVPTACILPVVIWIVAMTVAPIRENLGHRSIVFSIGSIVGSLIAAACLWQPGFATLVTRRRLAFTLLMQAVLQTIGAIMMFVRPAATLQEMASAPLTAISASTFVVLIILFTCKMIMEDSEKQLKDLARIDSLTGVLNRRGFFESFEAIRLSAIANRRLIAVVLFDLDHFKQINDRYGHAAGDQALLAFSRIGVRRTGTQGAFARLGGEEFAAALAVEDFEGAKAFAESIRLDLAQKRIVAGLHTICATVSGGMNIVPPQAASPDIMLSVADKALYAAKHAGRNRLVIAGSTGRNEADSLDGKLRELRAILDDRSPADQPRETTFKHG